ncbi:hypothetical protein K7X08_029046 [Anisodus acutangulus]|uniref:Uncharacterized protein n=1 Tax=Anisodus acutangulus TaxID=402998 RepID=A0A9Q1L1Y4_9SOLA|nr:hypothetical protein K7X08_029046 [Anisodus acutangulus]
MPLVVVGYQKDSRVYKESRGEEIWWRESDSRKYYVGIGKDHTLFALKEGMNVKFEHHKLSGRKWVHVEPKDGDVLYPVYSSSTAAAAAEPKIAT